MKGRLGTWWMAALMMSAALGASLAEVSTAAAAPPGGGPRPEQVARVKALRGRVLRERVGLDEARAQKIEAIFEKYQPERRALRKAVRQTMRSLRELVDSNTSEDQAYSAAFAQLKAAQDKLRALRDQQQAEVARIVTPKEAAKLLLTMKKARFEKQRHHFQGGRHHGGGRHGQRGQGGGPEDGGGFGPGRGGSGFGPGFGPGPGAGDRMGPGGGPDDSGGDEGADDGADEGPGEEL